MKSTVPVVLLLATCSLAACAQSTEAERMQLPVDGGQEAMTPPQGGQTGSGGAGGATPSTGGASTGGASSGGTSSNIPDLTPTDASCRTGSNNQTACMSCCDTNHAGAYQVQAEQTRACACTTPGTCAAICSDSYCMSQPQTVRNCYSCVFPLLRLTGACFGVSLKACGSDADCATYVRCRANCAE